jgi:glycosyltransferase involved in cell wall biosynthesis
MFRFHILSVPHTATNKNYNACAFTQKVLKFGKMMTNLGHEVIHYGNEDSDLICSEHVNVTTRKDLEISYGNHDWRKEGFKFSISDHAYKVYINNTIRELSKRIQPFDFILAFFGKAHEKICRHFENKNCIIVEPGIGYPETFAPYKVFESYAWYHFLAHQHSINKKYTLPNWYDAVIPNYFDIEDFQYKEEKDDYFLYIGRVTINKGVDIAIDVTEKLGSKLIIAGQMTPEMAELMPNFPQHVEYIGYADANKRKELMSKAKAGFVPSRYIEPFGGVQIELLLSGTPTITTDWGAFAENNLHNITGYRCRTFDQFVWAAKNISNIKSENCRFWAENFTLEKVGLLYQDYFDSIYNFTKHQSWYKSDITIKNYSSLSKTYPI